MVSKGNGAPERCADNLLKIFRGEVPFERVKGLDPRNIDRPIGESEADIRQDATWLLTTYEPRVTVSAINIETDSESGQMVVTADVIRK